MDVDHGREVNIQEKDDREEAKERDENAIGVYKTKTEDDDILVGHVPIELLKLMKYYLEANESNNLLATVTGKRKREVGLVVPGKFKCMAKKCKLHEELLKKKMKYNYLKLKVNDFEEKVQRLLEGSV